MAVVVNSHAAHVHTHVFRVDGGEGFFLTGQGVVDCGHINQVSLEISNSNVISAIFDEI